MRIALDCMGGDGSPVSRNVSGAVEAVEEGGLEIILVGDKDVLAAELSKYADSLPLRIEHAGQVVAMGESLSSAIRRKKNSSIWVAVQLVKEGKAEAVVSAGNTGAVMAIAKVQLGMLPYVERPAIAIPLPKPGGFSILLDAGANVDCKPEHLCQFALMGSVYARDVCGKKSPRVGLLNVGEEESKGNELTKEAYRLLKQSNINFIGNVEGKDIFTEDVDVIVCDGFIGNIVLKVTESVAEGFRSVLHEGLKMGLRGKLAGLLMRRYYGDFKKKISRAEYGGAPLLGINGACMISHGSSSVKAIKNAILCGKEFVSHNLNECISETLEKSDYRHRPGSTD